MGAAIMALINKTIGGYVHVSVGLSKNLDANKNSNGLISGLSVKHLSESNGVNTNYGDFVEHNSQ